MEGTVAQTGLNSLDRIPQTCWGDHFDQQQPFDAPMPMRVEFLGVDPLTCHVLGNFISNDRRSQRALTRKSPLPSSQPLRHALFTLHGRHAQTQSPAKVSFGQRIIGKHSTRAHRLIKQPRHCTRTNFSPPKHRIIHRLF